MAHKAEKHLLSYLFCSIDFLKSQIIVSLSIHKIIHLYPSVNLKFNPRHFTFFLLLQLTYFLKNANPCW